MSGKSNSHAGFASGWDLVFPAGWTMAFWIALVYRGVRVGGLREISSVCLQEQQLCIPADYIDSDAGLQETTSVLNELKMKYDRRPPAKRPNYVKLGIPFPFEFKGDDISKVWSSNISEMKGWDFGNKDDNKEKTILVIRERKMLRLLESMLINPRKFINSCKKFALDKQADLNIYDCLMLSETGKRLINTFLSAMVPVSYEMLLRGVPYGCGHVCLPSADDLNMLETDKTYGGPVEPRHKDPGQVQRKAEKRLKTKSKRKVKSNIASMKGMFGDSSMKSLINESNEASALKEKDMDNFDWINHTDRQIIGFVKSGDFDLSKGKGSGMAFCSVAALLELCDRQRNKVTNKVLIRNRTSLQYRFATLNLIV